MELRQPCCMQSVVRVKSHDSALIRLDLLFLFRLFAQLIAHLARPRHVHFNQLKSHKIIESNRIKAKRSPMEMQFKSQTDCVLMDLLIKSMK